MHTDKQHSRSASSPSPAAAYAATRKLTMMGTKTTAINTSSDRVVIRKKSMYPLPTAPRPRPRQTASLDAKAQQLRAYSRRLRVALPGSEGDDDQPGRVDVAWEVFAGMQDDALALARALALGTGSVVEETVGRLERLSLGGGGGGGESEVDALGDALSGLGISDGAGLQHVDAVRAWGTVVRRLREAYDGRGGIITTAMERGTGSTTTTKVGQSWEARWRQYEALGRTLEEVARLTERMRITMGGGEEGERGGVRECVIAERGDVVLEFPNVNEGEEEDDDEEEEEEEERMGMSMPVLRYRVSSAMLTETSPFFARLFAAPPYGTVVFPETNIQTTAGEEEEQQQAAARPVYRVIGRETDAHGALTILLCAAHMQHDRVPQAVRFEQLVAIAEVCLRYKCTAPVEVFVAHLWLPAWIHKAAEEAQGEEEGEEGGGGGGGDGLVMVSYVFGLRRLFARVSKTAVLVVVDEVELAAKRWPERVKDRIWAVRNAKMAQVYAACSSAVQEYLRPPEERRVAQAISSPPPVGIRTRTRSSARPSHHHHHNSLSPSTPQQDFPGPASASASASAFSLTTTPRCPKGSHACDAANLGWLLLVLNELQLLHAVMSPGVVLPSQQPRRSLAQLLDVLRGVPSPTSPVHHTGVCDPALALRSAVNDVYNSVTGLTLFEVDGKRHGWALSRGKVREAQSVLNIPLGVLGLEDGGMEVASSRFVGNGDMDESLGGIAKSNQGTEEEEEEEEEEGEGEEGSIPRIQDIPRLAFQPDEATCLRILSFLDASDDLYAAARTNRTFYAAFQRNELALMRRLVRANRRLTLSVLAGMASPLLEESKAAADSDPGGEMTEEEACRILWPDDETPVSGDSGVDKRSNDDWEHVLEEEEEEEEESKTRLGQGMGQKVLVTPGVMVEEKTLIVMGDKFLREQLDRRKGIASD